MIYIKPLRAFTRTNIRFQNSLSILSKYPSSVPEERTTRDTLVGPHKSFSMFACDVENRKLFERWKVLSLRESRRASNRLIYSEELVENGECKIIPITIVTSFMDEKHIISNDPNANVQSVPAAGPSSSKPGNAPSEDVSKVLAVQKRDESPGKGAVRANDSVRNEWTRVKPQRPKTNLESIHFKETYEKLKRLGLLKARLGNCYVGMTSPSGKYKFDSGKNLKRKGSDVSPFKGPNGSINTPPRKLPQIKNKFLQNNVVVKVQHYYESQGKEIPEEIKNIASGRSLRRRRSDLSTEAPYNAKPRRYQLYPCTSPSQTHFTRNFKNTK